MISGPGLWNCATLAIVMTMVEYLVTPELAIAVGIALLGLMVGDIESRTLSLQEDVEARP